MNLESRWQQRFSSYKKALSQLNKFIAKEELNELEHRLEEEQKGQQTSIFNEEST